MRARILAFAVAVFLAGLLLPAADADAVPAFARKYETSCQTCHVAYPKLNPFGESFRLNGFEWPGGYGEEEDQIKEEPIPLGSEGYKRVFPKAVWPGAIPGGSPISFRSRTGFEWEDAADGSRTKFENPTLQTMMAGTMGEGVSFFVGAHLFEDGSFDGASVDRFYLSLNDLFVDGLGENALDVRIGQFIPEVVPFASNHRGLTLTSYAFTTYSPGAGDSFGAGHAHDSAAPDPGHEGAPSFGFRDEGHAAEEPHADLVGPSFGIEQFQLGIEANGLIGRRFQYALGLVNGGVGEETNSDKDVYGRLAWKVGGLAFDGTGGDSESNKNWAERSVSIAVFGYRGVVLDEEAYGAEELEIRRFGSDVSWYWNDLNLYGGYLHGRDDLLGEDGVVVVDFDMFFVEADYVVWPWLIGVVRYEQADPQNLDTIRRVVPHVTALHRANIKLQVETRLDPDDVNFDNVLFGVDFGY
jgi:hypothetical protein